MKNFKNSIGHWITRGLFYEQAPEKTFVCYTLKEHDHEGYESLRRLYLECDDPTEYTFAVTHLGGWEHWKKLLECDWFQPHIESWREELEIRTRAQALVRLKQAAANKEDKSSFQANKYLLDKGWVEKEAKNKVGRPTNDKIIKEAQKISDSNVAFLEDYQRLKGGVNE